MVLRLLLFAFLALVSTMGAAEKPNIVFILADDMGYMDLGCYGSDLYRTPNLDRLAAQGTRFTQMRTAAHVCSPTRASILTGKYPARVHLTDFLRGNVKPYAKLQVPDWSFTIPEGGATIGTVLKEQGYATAWLGKWHAGGGAQDHGFDAGNQSWEQNRKDDPQDPKGVFTLNKEAFEFIQGHKDQPFFVALSHYSVHGPIRFEPKLRDEYQKFIDEKKPRQVNAGYAAMVEALDTSVGQVLEFLEKEGLAKNTLIVFTSDNGGVPSYTNNAPLRAGKGTLYEGGIRVPLIARWPEHIAAGQTSDIRVCSTDFLPTFATLAGAAALPPEIDGVNVAATLEGKSAPVREALYWHYPHYHAEKPSGAILKGDWKLIEWFETGKTELFNIAADPHEEKDVAAENTGKAGELLADLKAWREKVGAQMMTPNPAYDPAREKEGPPKKQKKQKNEKKGGKSAKGAAKPEQKDEDDEN
jgi:arylsulfatase A